MIDFKEIRRYQQVNICFLFFSYNLKHFLLVFRLFYGSFEFMNIRNALHMISVNVIRKLNYRFASGFEISLSKQ